MKVAVWDTYVTKKDGSVMHFDIIVPEEMDDPAIIFTYGHEYLTLKGQGANPLTSNVCNFCHVETIKTEWEEDIMKKGYYIFEMENCN
jgi:hypothetical protein